MNLVQINERLKDMPLRAVQMYANGSNPQVPSYLALAEMQRREKMAKQAALEQGAADGPMPSIKEQIEQKVGLLALQQGRMQQGQQKLGEQATRMPMAVPQNVESAEEQPQVEDTGIASLPVDENMYDFAGGGLITFSDGGSTRRNAAAEMFMDARRKEAYEREVAERKAREERRAREAEREAQGMAAADAAAMAYSPNAQIRQAPPQQARQQQARQQQARPQAAPAAAEPQVSQQAAQQEAGAPQSQTTGLPAIFNDPQFMDIVKRSLKQDTEEEAFNKQKQLRARYGLDKTLGEEQERRIRERKAEYEARRPGGLDDLIRVLGQAAQYKGMSGMAPAYTSLQQQRRAEDMRFREEQDRMLDALEANRRQEAAGLFGNLREDLLKGKDISTRSAGTIAGEQMRATAEMARQRASELAQERLAGIKFEFERRLKAIPPAQRASLEEQYVQAQVRLGVPLAKAIEQAKRLGTSSDKLDLDTLKALQKSLMDQLALTSGVSKESRPGLQAQLENVNRQLMQMGGIGGGSGGGGGTTQYLNYDSQGRRIP
jgi:hypothetical protein